MIVFYRFCILIDVVGVIFMVVGSFMFILFIVIVFVFMGEGDIGLGIIIGLIMFNIFFILVICGLCFGMVIILYMWLLLRDFIVYIIYLIVLLIVIEDNMVYWYEVVVFLFLYCGYIIIMCYNRRFEGLFERLCLRFCDFCKGFEMVLMEDFWEIVNEEFVNEGSIVKFGGEEIGDKGENIDEVDKEIINSINEEKDKSDLDNLFFYIYGFLLKLLFEIFKSFFKLVIWVVMLLI